MQKDLFQDVVVTAGPPGPGVSSPWQQQVHLGTFLLVRQHSTGMKIFAPFFNNPQSTGIKKYVLFSCSKASECSAVKHCIKAVWEKETVPQDDDEVKPTEYIHKSINQ